MSQSIFQIARSTAYATAWVFLANVIYENYGKPIPSLTIEYKTENEEEKAKVQIRTLNSAPVYMTSIKHRNLECLHEKGYTIKQIFQGRMPNKEIMEITHARGNKNLAAEFKTCRVQTDIEYDALFGRTKKTTFDW